VHQRERAIEIGKKLLEKEARKYRISLKESRKRSAARGQRIWAGRPTI